MPRPEYRWCQLIPKQRAELLVWRKKRGRKVFFRAVERAMRSERHYWATLNYVHHNPVHHGYVERWTDWQWSSAPEYLAQTDLAEAKRIWCEYPLHDYGKAWDAPEM